MTHDAGLVSKFALGINIATVSNKLNKPGRLKLGEAQTIKTTFFPDLSIEYLFEAQERSIQ